MRDLLTQMDWKSLAGLGFAGLAVAAVVSRAMKLRAVSPSLRSRALTVMPPISGPVMPLLRHASRKMVSRMEAPAGVAMQEHHIARVDGSGLRIVDLRRLDRPRTGSVPALLWFHGGGFVMGAPEMDIALMSRMLNAIDVVILSVDYRLAPQDKFPAALDDAEDALRWVLESAPQLGVDPSRVAVGGNSAGAGLAAGLAQHAHDIGIALAFQMLMYPMLDDRTVVRREHAGRGKLVWTPQNNRYGWAAYLDVPPGAANMPPYAAPARREDLRGLAAAWIGVGTLDLFHDEDVAYAEGLRKAGVPCELSIVEDAPHIFDVLNFDAIIVRQFHDQMISALAQALKLE